MQHTLGISCRSRSVNGIRRVVVVSGNIARFGSGRHHIFPVGGGKLGFAAAVPADKLNALRSVGILDQRPRRARFPYADHRDNRHDAARKIDQHKILPADSLVGKIGEYSSAQIVELSVCNAFRVGFVKENRRVGGLLCVFFKHLQNSHSNHLFS